MFGTHLGIGSSLLAPAAAALPVGSAARRLPGRPSLSLALSGTLHGAALALFLVVWGGSPPEPPGIEIRVWTTPPIDLPRVVPPPIDEGGHEASNGPGTVVPGEENVDVAVVTEQPFVDGPVRERAVSPADGPGTEAGAWSPPEPADPDLPSIYEAPPVAIHAPEPEYPEIARNAGIEGRFLVEALVGRDGRVRDIRVREANPILEDAARKAILQWRFEPARWNGNPVAAWVAIPVVFRLH